MENLNSVKYATYFNFFPGDKVFVLLSDKIVRSGTVLEYNFKVFKRNDDITERSNYLIYINKDKTTASVNPEYVFEYLDDAVAALVETFNQSLEIVEVYDGSIDYISLNDGDDEFDASDPNSYYNNGD